MTTLFDPITLGKYNLPNRIFMSPMTRGRAGTGAVPTPIMADYYALRADAGLLITEATAISPQGYGWLNAPGIWTDAQEKGWKVVTDAVHAKGGRIFLQLWHTGRVSHPDFLDGQLPVCPSAVAAQGETHTPLGKKPYVTPRALSVEEIRLTIGDYASAAKRAISAGFDGVELHGANGYLVDEFIRDGSNKRTDEYGGSTDNRLRFLVEVTKALVDAVGADKVGVRLSPTGQYNDMRDSNPTATFTRAAELLNPLGLAYLHIMEALPGHMMYTEGERVLPHIRKVYRGLLLTNGGYTKTSGNMALENGEADAITFGMLYLANPDLVPRFKNDAPFNHPDFATLYTPGEKGYTDYPMLSQQ